MGNIIRFFKERYKIFIPVMVVLVLLVTLYFLYREEIFDNFRNKKEIEVVQYFGGIKTEYTAIFTYNLKDILIDIKAKDKKIEYDSTPIYVKDKDEIVFPEAMSLVFPLKEGSQYKVYKYGLYEWNSDGSYITSNGIKKDYSYYFLFDGKKLFFFPDEVTLYVDNKEYKKLSKNSYVKIVGGYTMEYYDKDSDSGDLIEIQGKTITVKNEQYEACLTERYVMSFGKKVLLVNPDKLNSLNN